MQNQTFEEWDPFYPLYLLWRYYTGQLLNGSAKEWQAFGWEAEAAFPALKEEIRRIKAVTEEDVDRFTFEYHKLFVGPGKLLASPYASSYLNPEGSLMQRETMSVRSFYERCGLQAADKGSEPEDSLSLELEFLLYLLARREKEEDALQYATFMKEHLKPWCFHHCELILKSTAHPICRFFAGLLELFLREELRRLSAAGTGNGRVCPSAGK